jgi:glutathione reductase (NADPH)
MSNFDFDLFVIGAGSGGVRASRIAASHGARVAVAEEHRVGGTCVIRGCVPKKLLVYGAHFAEDLKDARQFGWDVPDCKFDWDRLRDNVLAEVTRLEGLYGQTLENHKVTVFKTRATVVGPQKVRLADGQEISAERILIATGGWPHVPEFSGQRTCNHLERGVPSRKTAEARRHRGRRLYRQRICRHLQRVRQQGDDRQPRRHDPARL